MLRDVENAQRVYDAAFTRQNQSALESQATQTNVSVVKRASVPPFPSSPRWSVNAAVSLVLGALIGVATALAREHRDWRLRNEDDVLEIMRQPLLGVLPNVPRSPEPGVSGRVLQGLSMRLLGRSPPLAQG
jgi:capsular polysaccharide biosynthesis protein